MNREMDAAYNVVEESFIRHWFFSNDAIPKRGVGADWAIAMMIIAMQESRHEVLEAL